jgi:hypothetical protein
MRGVLQPDRSKRLGNINGGVLVIQEHEFFRELDWQALANLQLEPPYIPPVASDADDGNFALFSEDAGPAAAHGSETAKGGGGGGDASEGPFSRTPSTCSRRRHSVSFRRAGNKGRVSLSPGKPAIEQELFADF